MTDFVMIGTNIVSLNYDFVAPAPNMEIQIETSTTTKILRSNADPKKILIEAEVRSSSPSVNLTFNIKTITAIELNLDMSDAEINNKCLPLVFTAVNEKIKALTGCMNAPHLELPPVQLLVENLLYQKK